MVGAQSQRFNTTTAAATPTGNILSGTQYEYVSVPTVLSVYCAEDVGDVLGELVLGQRRVMPSSPIPVPDVAGTGPNTNQHQVARTPVMPGERIQLSFVGGVGASAVRTLLVLEPVM